MSFDVGKDLSPALQKAIDDYLNFSEARAPTDIKEFNAYHTACKSALLHIALLVKLTQNQRWRLQTVSTTFDSSYNLSDTGDRDYRPSLIFRFLIISTVMLSIL